MILSARSFVSRGLRSRRAHFCSRAPCCSPSLRLSRRTPQLLTPQDHSMFLVTGAWHDRAGPRHGVNWGIGEPFRLLQQPLGSEHVGV